MKKVFLSIVLFLTIVIPFNASALREGITSYYIDATIKDNGDMNIKELIILNGKFNGFNRIINYKNNSLAKFDGSLASFKGSSIYNGDGIGLVSIKSIDVNSNNNFDLLYNSGDEFESTSSAEAGDYGKYIVTNKTNGVTYKIFNPSKGKERGFYVEYNVKNIGVVHNDIAEVSMNLFDELTEFVNNLEMHIHIPNNKELLRGWAHGPLTGVISIENNQYIKVTASNIEANTPIDVRFAFDKNILNKSTKKSGVDALNKIIEVETKRADIANQEREEMAAKLERLAIKDVGTAEKDPSRYNHDQALESVNYLPASDVKTSLQNRLAIVLERVLKDEANLRKIKTAIFTIWLIILVFIIYTFYQKHDKEYESDFKGDYYRDFPANYGPEIVSYLLNKNVSNNDLSACLTNLIYKKAVLCEESLNSKGKKTYLLTKNVKDKQLTIQEEQLLSFLIGDTPITLEEIQKKAKNNYEGFILGNDTWKRLTIEVGKNENFFEISGSKRALYILYSILGLLLSIVIGFDEYTNYIWLSFLVFAVSIISLVYFIASGKRTVKGNNDYRKWLGLKRFLTDFSNIDKRELPEIALWEKYLVYAIPLGCAKKLAKDMEIRIKDIDPNQMYGDVFDTGYLNRMLIINNTINRSVASTVQAAYAEKTRKEMSDISNSSHSSGGGFGGGFSSGGGFGGGGGGGGRF